MESYLCGAGKEAGRRPAGAVVQMNTVARSAGGGVRLMGVVGKGTLAYSYPYRGGCAGLAHGHLEGANRWWRFLLHWRRLQVGLLLWTSWAQFSPRGGCCF